MKDLYTRVNEKLDRLEFSKKTKLLIGIISVGMMAIGFFMLVSIFSIKYDYEMLYQKRTLPQVNLEDIKDIYSVNIFDTLHDIKNRDIDIEDAIEVITSSREIIRSQWQNYNDSINKEIKGAPKFANLWLNLFLPAYTLKHDDFYQQGLVGKIKRKILNVDSKINQILEHLQKDNLQKTTLITDNVFLDINSINIYLTSLIKAHLKESISEKYRNDKIFNTSIIMLFFLIASTFFLSIIISLLIINHFKKLNESLESNVMFKTKELRFLNESLEKKIKKEVENSRKKDTLMFQQARLASMGEMIANIAHQWRQPLGSMMMIIQGIQTKMSLGKLSPDLLDVKVHDAILLGENMSDTLKNFQNFFKPTKAKESFTLKSCIEHSLTLSKYILEQHKINVSIKISESIKLHTYYNELSHVFLNIVANAEDALSLTKGEKFIEIVAKEVNDKIYIYITDNGGGIKEDVLPHIFEPYFTTKYKSKGTGLGLYMSQQIIEKHMQGTIRCKNVCYTINNTKYEHCTLFTIILPHTQSDKNDT